MSIDRFVALLQDLDGVTSTKEKTSILQEYVNDPDVVRLLNMALSPYITFGVKNFDLPASYPSTRDSRATDHFFNVADRLQARELTGGAARGEIVAALTLFTETEAEIMARVLRQDLKVNVGKSLINKAAGRPVVDDFDVQLADKMSDKFDWNGGPYFVEYKYDGMRLVAFVNIKQKTVEYRSRDGRIQENVPVHITEQLLDAARCLECNVEGYDNDVVFDGEIISQADDGKESYHNTMSMMKSKSDKDRTTLRYRMFDAMPFAAFAALEYDKPMLKRRRDVLIACGHIPTVGLDTSTSHWTHVLPSQAKLCSTADEIREYYGYLLDIGSEGAIIKKPNSLYLWKRSRDWVKLKPVFTADLTCTGIYEGDELNGFKGTLGGLVLEGELEDGTYVECHCGSGFKVKPDGKNPTRDEIFNDPSLVVGKTIEVEYQEVTMAANKNVHSLRFVIFKHIRYDK